MNYLASRFSDLENHALQVKHLVTWPHKLLAIDAGISPDTVSRLAKGQWPVTLFRAFQFAMIQNDYTLVQLVAAGAKATVIPSLPPLEAKTLMQLLTELVIRFGEFLPLAEKVRSGTQTSRTEKIKLREAWENLKQIGEAIIQQAELHEDDTDASAGETDKVWKQ